MYSPHSPALSNCYDSRGEHHSAYASSAARQRGRHSPQGHQHLNHAYQFSPNSPNSNYSNYSTSARSIATPPNISAHFAGHAQLMSGAASLALPQTGASVQCLRFKYFATFFIATTCLALLSASLVTHKWLVSKPMRVLRLTNGQTANFTALMLTAALGDTEESARRQLPPAGASKRSLAASSQSLQASDSTMPFSSGGGGSSSSLSQAIPATPSAGGTKFQGEIYFGLFNGVKVLNYGFGDRVSQLSVLQAYYATTGPASHELVNFRFWLATLTGVVLGATFALIGSIFAIINFVMTPRDTISGPVGLVIWNAAACFSCLLALFAWLVEYFLRLKANVLTPEEVANGWTSENRSQFGYSYYFVALAFVLHLVNIFIVSIVQADTWTSQATGKTAARRQGEANSCEGVIMLY